MEDKTKQINQNHVETQPCTNKGKNFKVAVLLDVYGAMLSEKQRDVIDLYYNEDLSLAEIAQHQDITRQGVRDSIKRGEQFLFEFEEKLGLLKKQKEQNKVFNKILELSTNLLDKADNNDVKVIANQLCDIASSNI